MSRTRVGLLGALLINCACTHPGQPDAAEDTGFDTGIVIPDLPGWPGSPKLDLPVEDNAGFGCSALDMLFVLDNSASMQTHHEALASAFPEFITTIFSHLPHGTDVHIGLTTTDVACKGMECRCTDATLGCQSAASAESIMSVYAPPADGSNGVNGSQGRLLVTDGRPYFAVRTNEDPAELIAWFKAATGSVGELGCSFEMPVAAAGFVADSANATTNAGFIRDEGAALVVFILTDEPDKSPEVVDTYADRLRAVKQKCGGDTCISAAGLVPGCVVDGKQSLGRFLDGFGEPSVWGDIEDPAAYVEIVERALAGAVAGACAAVPVP